MAADYYTSSLAHILAELERLHARLLRAARREYPKMGMVVAENELATA